MRDLRRDLTGLRQALQTTPADAGGRTVMFVSARAGEGVSSVASSIAMLLADAARKPVWLVDLDVRRNQHFNAFAVGEFAALGGGVGRPYSALLNTQPFFSAGAAADPDPLPADAYTVHRVGDTRLMVTWFDEMRAAPGQPIRIQTRPAWWAALRTVADWAVVDAPALERSGAALAVASQIDRTIIVVEAD